MDEKCVNSEIACVSLRDIKLLHEQYHVYVQWTEYQFWRDYRQYFAHFFILIYLYPSFSTNTGCMHLCDSLSHIIEILMKLCHQVGGTHEYSSGTGYAHDDCCLISKHVDNDVNSCLGMQEGIVWMSLTLFCGRFLWHVENSSRLGLEN